MPLCLINFQAMKTYPFLDEAPHLEDFPCPRSPAKCLNRFIISEVEILNRNRPWMTCTLKTDDDDDDLEDLLGVEV